MIIQLRRNNSNHVRFEFSDQVSWLGSIILLDHKSLLSLFFKQEQNVIFKKGLLMNAGFIEVSKSTDIPCYAFHDVDMLPMHTGISYNCMKGVMMHPARLVRQYNFSWV